MKYYLLLALLVNNLYYSQKYKQAFTINGNIHGLNNKYIYFSYIRFGKEKKERKWDSTKIKNSQFKFTGIITESKHGFITTLKKNRVSDLKSKAITQRLFIDPNSKMNIVINAENFQYAKVIGGASQKEYDAFIKEYEDSKENYIDLIQDQEITDSLNRKYYKENRKNNESLDAKLDSINSVIDKKDEYYSILKKHVLDNPNSYSLLYLLSQEYSEFSYSDLNLYYSKLNTLSKNNEYGIELKKQLEKLKLNLPGNEAINFQSKDFNNQNISLKNYKGKYILLDFWASWCKPCREGNPKLIEIYNKYKDKDFVIIGIADDKGRKSAWKKAITKDNIGIWPQIIDDKSIAKKYVIEFLPTKILIDRDFKIIHRFNYDDNLEFVIDELFNK